MYTHTHTHIREGNGNPLQHSFLENSMDRGAWHLLFIYFFSIRKKLGGKSDSLSGPKKSTELVLNFN